MESTAGVSEWEIQRNVFQGDLISSLLFVTQIMKFRGGGLQVYKNPKGKV